MSMTTWQRNERVLAAARTDMWPAGTHKLGVHYNNGVAWNCGEIDRRIAAGEYTASQCLSRLTDGMPNHHGPDNGPGRPTLATKWKNAGLFPAADVDRHVDALREHVAIQVAQKIGLLQRGASHSPQGGDAASASPERKRPRAGAAECTAAPVSNKQARAASGSEFSCGVRLTGRPGDPIPGGRVLSRQIFVTKTKSIHQNQQSQLSKIRAGELSIEYALLCMRDGGPLRRNWKAGSNPSVRRHIDELCAFLSDIKQRAMEGTYGGGAA